MKESKPVAIYVRVSTDDKGQDIELQISECKRYCKAYNWDYEGRIFKDHDTGYLKPAIQRTGFAKLMNLVKTHKIHAVVVYSMDRFSRENPYKAEKYLNYIVYEKKRIFVAITDGVDSRNDSFPIVQRVMSWQANNWSKAHSARVKAGIAKKRLKNKRWGRKPLSTKKKNQIKELNKLGSGVREIARKLNISPSTVSKIINKKN